MSKYKVLRIINRLNLGGPTYNATYLTKYLEDDFETTLLSGMRDESEAGSEHILESVGLKARYIKGMFRSLNPLKDYQSYRQIRAIIRELKPDIVHTHAAKAGAVGRLAAFHEKVPVVIHTFHGHVFHGYFNPLITLVFKLIERYLASKSNAIIAISKLQKEDLSKKYAICDENKISVIPLGFDLDKFYTERLSKRRAFRLKHHIEENEIALGIISRLVPIKNHQMFIDLVAQVNELHPGRIKAFIIGDGESGEMLRKYAISKGFKQPDEQDCRKNSLVFTSWITEVDKVYAGLDIVALTSHNEGTPVSLIEAQASAKAVLSTAVGGVEDVVLDKRSGHLSVDNDMQAMYENLLMLMENKEQLTQFGQEGENWVKERFSYQRLTEDVKKLYLNLLKD